MNKVHYDDDQPELLKLCDGRMFEICEDLNEFRKSASSRLFSADELDAARPDKDHFLIHNVGMGDQETYGQNRNGDGWPKHACEERHNTFVTHGAFYREHRNRSKKESIGSIKVAGFHPSLRRIETIMWGDKRKAEEEYEMAKAGKALSFSMSARVPWDECSCCHHRAKRASAYCDHLALHMNQWMPEFQKYAFAENHIPTFYDMSRVRMPADRIAHYLEYRFGDDEMQKAAATRRIITGTDWAEYEGVLLPDMDEPIPFDIIKQAMLQRLAAEEIWLDTLTPEVTGMAKHAFAREIVPVAFASELTEDELTSFRSMRSGTLFHELAKRAAVMPFISFAAYALGTTVADAIQSPVVKQAATTHLPHIFSTLQKIGDEPALGSMFDASDSILASCDTAKDAAANAHIQRVSEACSIDPEAVRNRILYSDNECSRPEAGKDFTKAAASTNSDAVALAEAYGQYQLRALCDMEHLLGNDINDSQTLLSVGANRHVYR